MQIWHFHSTATCTAHETVPCASMHFPFAAGHNTLILIQHRIEFTQSHYLDYVHACICWEKKNHHAKPMRYKQGEEEQTFSPAAAFSPQAQGDKLNY